MDQDQKTCQPCPEHQVSPDGDDYCTNPPKKSSHSHLEDILVAVCVLLIVVAVTFRALARSPGRRAKNRRANGSKMSSGMDPSLFTPVRTRHESNRSQLDRFGIYRETASFFRSVELSVSLT